MTDPRIASARQLIADSAPKTPDQWTSHFMREGEAYVARAQELGGYITDPYGTALMYAQMRVFDAMVRGQTKVDLKRARETAEYLSGHSSKADRQSLSSIAA